MKKITTILLLICFSFLAPGQNIITVVNNMDAGIGSLRWAIQQSSANGAGLTDTIKFDLGNPLNRIIVLDTELPDIPNNVIIDGTTQPGAALSTQTSAKIVIRGAGYPQVRRGLTIINASRIGIYGLAIVNFIPADPINGFDTYADGIFMQNASDIEIGRVLKGNVISGNYFGIRIDSIPALRPGPALTPSKNIRIYANQIGPRAGIATTGGTAFAQSGNLRSVYFNGVSDVAIGGLASGTGANVIEAVVTGVQLIIKNTPASVSSFTQVVNNTFNPAGSFNAALASITKTAINVAMDPANSYGYNPVTIATNIVSLYNNAIAASDIKNRFTITQNELTCTAPPAAPRPYLGVGIAINNCDSGLVGGSVATQNLIERFPQGAVLNNGSRFVTVSRNIIKCTGSTTINGITNLGFAGVPAIILDSMTPNVIIGRSCATCKIEVFRNNECLPQWYNGKIYDTTLICIGGNFRYDGMMDCAMSFTSTDANGSTSKFYLPYNFIYDSSGLQVTPVTCERQGKISGIRFFKDVEWEWQNATGGAIGTDTTLEAPAGQYRLVAKLKSLGCVLRSSLITIPEYFFDIDSTFIRVINPYQCKPAAGSITGLTLITRRNIPSGPLIYQWKNQAGTVVGNQLNLLNVVAGTYSLRITSQVDPTCFKEAGPYVLTLQPNPVMDISMATVKNDACGNSEGGVSGITIINPAPAGGFLWVNDAGVIVGSDAILTGVPAGRYRLKYKDFSPCDTLYSPFYTIGQSTGIGINVSAAVIKPSGCGRSIGSITNVTVTNATSFYWINVNTGDTVSNTINATNLKPGLYRLLTGNGSGCSRASPNVQVDSTNFIDIQAVMVSKRPASCGLANGFINLTQFNKDTGFYQFKWLNTAGNIIGTNASLFNINQGSYRLLATDSNGCTKIIYTDTIGQTQAITINVAEIYREADTCGLLTGRFSNIVIQGGSLPYTYRITDSSGTVISTSAGASGLAGGRYAVQVADSLGCRSPLYPVVIASVATNLPAPVYRPLYVLRGSDTAIRLPNSATNGGRYQLLDANRNLISENATGRFIFQNIQSDFNGFVRLQKGSCTTADAVVKIAIADTLIVKIPNAFSPNGDGINDVFTIGYQGLPIKMDIAVYDRYGKLVYQSASFDKPWNGKSNSGKPMPAGVYYWLVKGTDLLGANIIQQGSVTLLR